MKKSDYLIAVALVLGIVVAVKYLQPQQTGEQVLDLPPETVVQPAVEEPAEPAIRYPVPELPQVIVTAPAEPEPLPQKPAEEAAPPVPEKPLPTLDDSDDAIRQDLYTLAARRTLDSLLNLNHIVRRFVVTVDNLPRRHLLNSKHRANQSVPGQLIVEQDENGFYLSKKNYARYNAYIDLLDALDSQQLIALYLHYYPLIQAAYQDQGYPSAYFNDRLIDVIDHLLETPDTGGRVSLVRPHVLFLFADPELEGLSAGQKVLLRIGPRNAARVKAKLRELRKGLVRNPGRI
ncbi:DUF3014 family protein [Thiogranum longum]|uniref:DUF3014 family protein n=1 Tax=Thiogranum longum TaxID=1537524 RepID=A0A4R1HEJ1_9GAMM|nr:DUF3014 domain-containing protein [Thiogranum longum]TCK18735.1 DUF3014 family protein [Thiogranum longum]